VPVVLQAYGSWRSLPVCGRQGPAERPPSGIIGDSKQEDVTRGALAAVHPVRRFHRSAAQPTGCFLSCLGGGGARLSPGARLSRKYCGTDWRAKLADIVTDIIQEEPHFAAACALTALVIITMLLAPDRHARKVLLICFLMMCVAAALVLPALIRDQRMRRDASRELEALVATDSSALEVLRRDLGEVLRQKVDDPLPLSVEVVPTTQLRLRAGPNTQAEILAVLAPNERLVFRGRREHVRGNWILVEGPAGVGWVHTGYLVTWFAMSGGSGPGAIGQRPLITLQQTVLREAPSADGEVLCALPGSAKVALQRRSGLWAKVRHQRVVGWVPVEALRFAGAEENRQLFALRVGQVFDFLFPESTPGKKLLGFLGGVALSVILALLFGPVSGVLSAVRLGCLAFYFIFKLWIVESLTFHEYFVAAFLTTIMCVGIHWSSGAALKVLKHG